MVSPPGHHLLGLQMLHRPSTWLEATCTSTSPAFAHHPHTGHVRYHHVSTMPPRIVGSTTTRETDDARAPHARFQSCSQHTMETHGVPLPMHALVALPTARSKQPYMSRRKARYGSRTTPHVGEIEHKTVLPRGPTPHTRMPMPPSTGGSADTMPARNAHARARRTTPGQRVKPPNAGVDLHPRWVLCRVLCHRFLQRRQRRTATVGAGRPGLAVPMPPPPCGHGPLRSRYDATTQHDRARRLDRRTESTVLCKQNMAPTEAATAVRSHETRPAQRVHATSSPLPWQSTRGLGTPVCGTLLTASEASPRSRALQQHPPPPRTTFNRHPPRPHAVRRGVPPRSRLGEKI